MIKKSRFRHLVLTAALALSQTAYAEKAEFPPLVKLVVPFAPGASTDVLARALAHQLGPRLNTKVVVENKPGASGLVGSSQVAKAPGDGSTIMFVSVSLLTSAATMKNPPLDVLNDLKPVAIFGEGPLVVGVANESPIRTFKDLVQSARSQPNELTHGTGGVGTIAHMTGELMDEMGQVQIRHIPYRGASPAVTDMLGGRLDVMFAVKATFASQVEAGKIRLLAITSVSPSPEFPGLPTVSSEIPGYDVSLWTGVFAPKDMPPALIAKLNSEINAISQTPQIKALMKRDGAMPTAMSPEDTAARVKSSFATWQTLAKAKNIVFE